eukprot:TRINITY_DN777934_c0_g1_i1.p1 TRINITY_DN777934_c0_g1~~TRINITY_DN777934_c0_g1_i1.p1  ORF type:complete len:389 (-),score=126.08 TRINITY_DN777934_c0_g1_i1:253-1419(-)
MFSSKLVQSLVAYGSSFNENEVRQIIPNAFFDDKVICAEEDDKVVCFWRGTQNMKDLETDVKFDGVQVPFLDDENCLVHEGFLERAALYFPAVLDIVENTEKPVVLSGHSMGACIAQIVTLFLLNSIEGLEKRVICVNFAAPLCFNSASSKLIELKYTELFHNIVSGGDPIPRLLSFLGREEAYEIRQAVLSPNASWQMMFTTFLNTEAMKNNLQKILDENSSDESVDVREICERFQYYSPIGNYTFMMPGGGVISTNDALVALKTFQTRLGNFHMEVIEHFFICYADQINKRNGIESIVDTPEIAAKSAGVRQMLMISLVTGGLNRTQKTDQPGHASVADWDTAGQLKQGFESLFSVEIEVAPPVPNKEENPIVVEPEMELEMPDLD